MNEYNETFDDSSNDSRNFVVYRISLAFVIFFILIAIFLIGSGCYNLCFTSEPATTRDRTTWSTDRRSQNRVIRKQKRKPIIEPTDVVDDASMMNYFSNGDGSSVNVTKQFSRDVY